MKKSVFILFFVHYSIQYERKKSFANYNLLTTYKPKVGFKKIWKRIVPTMVYIAIFKCRSPTNLVYLIIRVIIFFSDSSEKL